MSPSGFDVAKERLTANVQIAIDHLNDLLTSVAGPDELREQISWVGNDLATVPPENLLEFADAAGIYVLKVGDDEVTIRMYTTGTAQTGGGWSYKRHNVYSCLQLSGKIGSVPDLKVQSDNCDSPLVRAAFEQNIWVYIPFKELGSFSTG